MFKGGISVAVAATVFALAAGIAHAAGDEDGVVAPLTGENLAATELGGDGTSTVTGTCNLLGPSTFTFTVTGVATGPYAGTLTESGTVTIDNALATTTAFDASFTIDSPTGTVTGTKTLSGTAPAPLGLCGTAAFPTGGADSLHVEGTVDYSATIATPTGTATDSGESFVNLQDAQVRGRVGFNGFAFLETFASTSVAPVCDDDEDGDDQGDQGNQDCDDQGEDEDGD